jgi:hypothetical protein
MTALELPNSDIFKQYLLTLLREDTSFKDTLIDVLFKDAPYSFMKPKKTWTPRQKVALAKKHAINPDVIKGLQDLFKDEPPAQEIIQTIQK